MEFVKPIIFLLNRTYHKYIKN